MQPNETDTSVANEEVVEKEGETSEETTETTAEPTSAELSARLKRAEAKIERMKIDAKVEKKVEKVIEKTTGELSEAQQDFFELKGYDEDQVDVFAGIMKKTGMSHREVIKDDYALAKVKSIADKKAVQSATPSSTKRAGGQVGDVAAAAAKFKETGVLPDDRALANAVVDSIAKAGNDRLPPWQR
jgi:hypothetical protein